MKKKLSLRKTEGETLTFDITGLWDEMAAEKDVDRFISSIEVENSTIFSSTVTLTN